MSQAEVASLLAAGRAFVGDALEPQGFAWVANATGQGSGGFFGSGAYVRGDRRLELHFRYSLGLVTYHIGSTKVSHEDYMRHLGHHADAMYPCFSDDPLEGFRCLANDLRRYGGDFISGPGDTVASAKASADARSKMSGLAKLDET